MWDNRIGKFFRVLFVHTHRLPLEAEKWNENNQFPLFNTSHQRSYSKSLISKLVQKFNDMSGKVLKPKKNQPPASNKMTLFL